MTVQMPHPRATGGEREVRLPVEGGEIAGWLSGDGPPLLLLHGGPGLSDYTASLAAELAPSLTVFRYQQRGIAPSVVEGDRSVDGHVADAVAVLNGLGWDRAWIAGHSWGGNLAMHLAVAHPERVAALVVIDPLGALGDGGATAMGENLKAHLNPDELARFSEIEAHEEAGVMIEAEQVEGLGILWRYYFGDPATADPMPPMRMDLDGYAQTWESVGKHFEARTLEDGLPRLTAPSIFIHGQRDPIPAVETERTAALVPGAELHVLPKIGHFPWLEKAGSIVDLLQAFKAAVEAANTQTPISGSA